MTRIEMIEAYAKEVAQGGDISALKFEAYDTDENFRKDDGELNAAAKKAINRVVNEHLGKNTPKETKKSFKALRQILHDGKTYKAGDEVGSVMDEAQISALLKIGAVEKK